MNLRLLSPAALAALLPLGAQAAQEDIVFEDPSMKGSLVEYGQDKVPRSFRGLWADKLENCHATSDRGVQARISEFTIGSHHVVKVEGYSDHSAIIVTVANKIGEKERIDLDISLDDQYVRLKRQFRDDPILLRRCPTDKDAPRPSNEEEQRWQEHVRMACKAGDFFAFFEAFQASFFVQRRYLAPRIKIVDATGKRTVSNRDYRKAPIATIDYHYVLNDGSANPEKLKVDIRSLDDNGYRVDWARAIYEDKGEGDSPGEVVHTYGLPGWLIFDWKDGCWQLVEDGLAEQPGQ